MAIYKESLHFNGLQALHDTDVVLAKKPFSQAMMGCSEDAIRELMLRYLWDLFSVRPPPPRCAEPGHCRVSKGHMLIRVVLALWGEGREVIRISVV